MYSVSLWLVTLRKFVATVGILTAATLAYTSPQQQAQAKIDANPDPNPNPSPYPNPNPNQLSRRWAHYSLLATALSFVNVVLGFNPNPNPNPNPDPSPSPNPHQVVLDFLRVWQYYPTALAAVACDSAVEGAVLPVWGLLHTVTASITYGILHHIRLQPPLHTVAGLVLPVWGLWLGAQLARLSAAGAYTASVGDGGGAADGGAADGGAADGARSGSGLGSGGSRLAVTVDSAAEGDKPSGYDRPSSLCELSVGVGSTRSSVTAGGGLGSTGASQSGVEQRA